LDQYIDTGAIWAEVDALLEGAVNADGSIKTDSDLMNLLKESEGFGGLSKVG
jgi:hypothetical protein